MKNHLSAPAIMLLSLALLLSACLPPASTPTPDLTASAQPATETPKPTEPLPAAFPLGGTWKGLAQNGALAMRVAIILQADCRVGDACGTYDLSLPCSGEFNLVREQDGIYEFKAVNKSASCSGEGQDFLQLLPDGRLRYTSRGEYGETVGTLTLIAAPVTPTEIAGRINVFDDDDGSPDGSTALFYLLTQPGIELVGAGISYGEAHPNQYIEYIGRTLDYFGFPGIPLGAGIDGSLSGVEGFPEGVRSASAAFWGWPRFNEDKNYPVQTDADLIIQAVEQSPSPVMFYFSGPLTNLALALRRSPKIRENIAAVYMMAGAVYAPGNISDFYPGDPNVYAEWNVYSDPQAYKEVFDAGLPLYLVPLDATNQVSISKTDTRQWRSGGEIANFIADAYDGLMNSTGTQEFAIWDLMGVMIMVDNSLCRFTPVHLDIITDAGTHFGQTAVVEDAEPNSYACLEPDVAAIKQKLIDDLSNSQ